MKDEEAISEIRNISKLFYAAILIFLAGGYVFYNFNCLNTHTTTEEFTERRLKLQKLYGNHDDISQPLLSGKELEVALYPLKGELGKLLYLQKHRLVSRKQPISIRRKESDVVAIDPLRFPVDREICDKYTAVIITERHPGKWILPLAVRRDILLTRVLRRH